MKPIPLTAAELELKASFQSHSELLWNHPFYQPDLDRLSACSGVDLRSLLPVAMEEKLTEAACIKAGEDIGILRHLRYLPAMYHKHTFFEMIYIFEGNCINHIGKTPVALKKGDFCLIAPGAIHALEAFSDEAVIYNFMIRSSTFEQVFQPSLLQTCSVLNDFFMQALYMDCRNACLLFHTGGDQMLQDFVRYACLEYEQQEKYWPQMMNNLMHAIFILLLRGHEQDMEQPCRSNHKASDEVVAILNYLRINDKDITLGRLAEQFSYSERHISRLLKERTGMNFHDILREFRLQRAAGLLENPNLSLPDIVEQVGYSDVSSFVRIFKKQYGMTPADYRKTHTVSPKTNRPAGYQ